MSDGSGEFGVVGIAFYKEFYFYKFTYSQEVPSSKIANVFSSCIEPMKECFLSGMELSRPAHLPVVYAYSDCV